MRPVARGEGALSRAAERVGERGAFAPGATDRIARLALPLACAIAWLVIAAFQREPSVAAEARYLGVLSAAILLAALQAAPRVGTLLGTTTVLLGAIPWALPGTADRGAATGVMLAAILAIAGVAVVPARGFGPEATSTRAAVAAWSPVRVASLVLGAQVLARSGDLLAPTSVEVIALVGWAAVAAGAILLLADRWGPFAATLAGAAAFALGPGFTIATATALAVPALATRVAGDAGAGRHGLKWRAPAFVALLLPLAWDFERGLFLLIGAAAIAGPRWLRWISGLAALIAFFAPGADRLAGLDGPAALVLLLPIVISELLIEAGSWRFAATKAATRFAAVCLALAIAAQIPDRAALALPAVLVALTASGARPLAASLQATWSGILAFAVAILAAYPWLRANAIDDAAALLGLGVGWRAALSTLLILALAALLCVLHARGRRAQGTPLTHRDGAARTAVPLVLALLLGAATWMAHPAIEASPIARVPVDLDARAPSWSAPLDTRAPVTTVVLDSSLSHAVELPTGTILAEVRLTTPSGIVALPLRAGVDTGEWAARRPDVASIAGFAAPTPYLHWVDSGRRFFGQRYRARLRLETPAEATAIEVRLAPDLPSDVVVTLFHLELLR